MSRIELDATPFAGRTSRPATSVATNPNCKSCGSQLCGRRRDVRVTRRSGVVVKLELYVCGCGRGRHVRREVAAA
jgi:hypothetical protein